MRDYLVRCAPLQVSRRPKVTAGVADSQDDQICLALLGCLENPLGRVAVLHHGVRTAPEFRVCRNELVEPVHRVGNRIFSDFILRSFARLSHDMQQDEASLIFLGH